MKHSIRNKILVLNLTGIFLCSILVGGIGYLFVDDYIYRDSDNYLKALGEKESSRISSKLESIEQYVKTLNYVVLEGIQSESTILMDNSREAHTRENLNFMRSTVMNVPNAIAVYLRYNPKLTPPTSGIFLSKTSKTSTIQKQVPTDFSKYSPDDIEHVGWYYIPIQKGRPIWMEPYENKNVDIYMISYVMPLFKFGQEIGVVGMDVNFGYLTQEISSIQLFKTGFAFLEDAEGNIAYHPTMKMGEKFQNYGEYKVVRNRLRNGMILVLACPLSEFNEEQNHLTKQIAFLTILITIISAILSMFFANSIIRPLTTLTESAKKMTSGELDVSFDTNRKDEIGKLAKSFDAARNHIKEYLGYIKGMAYKDALTSVRNKNALDNYIEDLKKQVDEGNITQFGIVAMDVNNLKATNDTYGHDCGNKLLVNACQLICKTFAHSPVFRVGGDEFLAILINNDFADRDRLMELLKSNMDQAKANYPNPWEQISIAAGLAVFDSAGKETFEAVAKRADESMYENKKQMKARAG
ncbi:MAG: diguanylate cyclase [Fibrobacter sp.]|nr:diguanylate cyclase [Fibrobacter sp.]